MNPNFCALYAGIVGAKLDVESFDFGHGVVISETFAHLMAPFLMAFSPAEPGQPHPGPWSAVSGGLGYDIHVQLYVPENFNPPQWFDRLSTVWWLLALMRLKATPLVSVPVISSCPYAGIPTSNAKVQFWPIEIRGPQLIPVEDPATILNESELNWIKSHWLQGGGLMNSSNDFNAAFQAFDSAIDVKKPSVSLMVLWGAIEQLFSLSKQELRFRLSATLASFLEPPGSNGYYYTREL